ncbi:hypothetical protein BYT27DRAFT_7339898 [Phlegmacium glaucopus]|nr:hypothetical protein BYT27DRAFT_7339898 [Phlegmacium glaucopus]
MTARLKHFWLRHRASPPPSAKPPSRNPPPLPPARDDQACYAKIRVLEVRPADYAKLMRYLEERRAEPQYFLPKLQAKSRKLQDELTGAHRKRMSAE